VTGVQTCALPIYRQTDRQTNRVIPINTNYFVWEG